MSKYALQLYINGTTPISTQAVEMLNIICEEKLNGEYYLEIIDIQQYPDRAEEEGIMAIPTLIRKWPLPVAPHWRAHRAFARAGGPGPVEP